MGTHDMPNMYACSPWALGIHIRQITRAHVTTIKRVERYATHLARISSTEICLTVEEFSNAIFSMKIKLKLFLIILNF